MSVITDLAMGLGSYKPKQNTDGFHAFEFDDVATAERFYKALDKYDQKIDDAKWNGSKVVVWPME